MRWLPNKTVLAQARAFLGRFVLWWIQELLGLLPARWREFNQRRIELRMTDDVIAVRICRPHTTDLQGRLDPSTAAIDPPELAARLIRESRRLPVWLVPPASAVLRQRVEVPRSAVPYFERLLAVECDRWTPFSRDEIAIAWDVSTRAKSPKSNVDLYFVPRASIDRWMGAVARFRLAPSVLVLSAENRLHAPIAAGQGGLGDRRMSRLATAVLAGAALILVLADWIGAVHERNAWQARVHSERSLLLRQKQIEQQIEEFAAGVQRTGQPRAVLLASIAKVLPQTDWLTEFSYREGLATLRGYSGNVEQLLKSFEPLASESVVTVQGDLAFEARLERHRFTIAFRVADRAQ